MDIAITISDFQRSLPIGISSHDDVYNEISPAIDDTLLIFQRNVLGDAGLALADAENHILEVFCKKAICQYAFLSVLRQLDLVLTPTGFGIVSNENVSPASKQRVDSLESDLRTAYCKNMAMVTNLLRSESWGKTANAVRLVSCVYDDYHYFFETHSSGSCDKWNDMKLSIQDAEDALRNQISSEMMDDILDAIRQNNNDKLQKYHPLIREIQRYDEVVCSKGSESRIHLNNIFNILEADLETFSSYASSKEYKVHHHENFQNIKESSAFIFNG